MGMTIMYFLLEFDNKTGLYLLIRQLAMCKQGEGYVHWDLPCTLLIVRALCTRYDRFWQLGFDCKEVLTKVVILGSCFLL